MHSIISLEEENVGHEDMAHKWRGLTALSRHLALIFSTHIVAPSLETPTPSCCFCEQRYVHSVGKFTHTKHSYTKIKIDISLKERKSRSLKIKVEFN